MNTPHKFSVGDVLVSHLGIIKVHEVRDDCYTIDSWGYGPVYEADQEWVEGNWRVQTPLEKLL